jgi:hypothetical protein
LGCRNVHLAANVDGGANFLRLALIGEVIETQTALVVAVLRDVAKAQSPFHVHPSMSCIAARVARDQKAGAAVGIDMTVAADNARVTAFVVTDSGHGDIERLGEDEDTGFGSDDGAASATPFVFQHDSNDFLLDASGGNLLATRRSRKKKPRRRTGAGGPKTQTGEVANIAPFPPAHKRIFARCRSRSRFPMRN